MRRPRPEEYQPHLWWWSHVWRTALMLLVSGGLWLTIAERQTERMFLLDVVAGVPALVLVFFRRRWPVPVAVVTTLLGSVSSLAAGPSTLAAVSLATRRSWVQVVGIALLSLATATIYGEVQPTTQSDPEWLTFSTNIVFISAILAWGMYIGSRRELLWTLRARAERAESERDLRANQSRLEERSRIAREMHDVLAHRISQISMRAGALSYRDDLSNDELREGAAVIREAAHEALTDLRGVLGVLRDESGELQHAPQPTYADLGELVAEAQRSGMRVTYVDDLPAGEPIPDAAGRTLYRIVQEGITNARKHAPGAELEIEVHGSPTDGIGVTLSNPFGFGPTATPGSGLGLVGLVERAHLRGGRLEHQREGKDFVLRGWIPWAA